MAVPHDAQTTNPPPAPVRSENADRSSGDRLPADSRVVHPASDSIVKEVLEESAQKAGGISAGDAGFTHAMLTNEGVEHRAPDWQGWANWLRRDGQGMAGYRAGSPEVAAKREPVIRATDPPNAEPSIAPNESVAVSTNNRAPLVLIKPPVVSTNESLQNMTQKELIGTSSKSWKRLKGDCKPPIPDRHVLNPSGKRKFGRKTLTGYEILRKAECLCGGEKRLTAGYVSATQLYDMGDDDYETQVGIIRQILRKRAGQVDRKLVGVRCAACCAGSEAQSQGVA